MNLMRSFSSALNQVSKRSPAEKVVNKSGINGLKTYEEYRFSCYNWFKTSLILINRFYPMASSGEQKVWEILNTLDPLKVCKNAAVAFDERGGYYILRSFCSNFAIYPHEKIINNLTPEGEIFIKKYGHFFILSSLWYLVKAQNIPPAGKLIKPEDLKGGDIFLRGTHILPLSEIARKYGNNKDAFIEKGRELCREKSDYGDIAVKLFPFPRIPVELILWLADDEFPSRADLLLDSTCKHHLPLDIIWSIAMFTISIFLEQAFE